MKLVLKVIGKILKWGLIYIATMLATGEVIRLLKWVEIDTQNDEIAFNGPIGTIYNKIS